MLALTVCVVGRNASTVDALRSYLDRAGVTCVTTQSSLETGIITASTSAVVLLPDDFEAADVVACVAALRATHPSILILLITSVPRSFSPALQPDGRSVPPIVLPKPAFGWTIVDAIRAHVDRP